ncbi:MAG: type II toxin-antitoxin system prevent-host-death family antitoxin [bacterium]
MTKIISVTEARKHFAEITDEVSQGTVNYIIVKNGKQIATINSLEAGQVPALPGVTPAYEKRILSLMDRVHDDLQKLADS